MLFEDLLDTTVPTTVECGQLKDGTVAKIVFDAKPCRVSFTSGRYAELLKEEHNIRADALELASKGFILFDENSMKQNIAEPVEDETKSKAKPRLRQPTTEEMNARAAAWHEEIRALSEKSDANEKAFRENRVARILWLAPSWDVTHKVNGVEEPLPLTEEALKSLPLQFIDGVFTAVEASVRGPLPTSGSSAS